MTRYVWRRHEHLRDILYECCCAYKPYINYEQFDELSYRNVRVLIFRIFLRRFTFLYSWKTIIIARFCTQTAYGETYVHTNVHGMRLWATISIDPLSTEQYPYNTNAFLSFIHHHFPSYLFSSLALFEAAFALLVAQLLLVICNWLDLMYHIMHSL